MIKKWLLIISLAMLTSCIYDPPSPDIWITNSSGSDVKLIVNFNKDFLFNKFGASTCTTCYSNYTGYYSDDCVQLLDFDTTKYVGKYILPNNCRFNLGLKVNQQSSPELEFDSLMIIKNNDTLKVDGSPRTIILFQKKKWDQYYIEIK